MLNFYLRYPLNIKRFGYFMPFKVQNKCKITVRPGGTLKLAGRLHIGNKKLPTLSLIPTNIFIEQGAKITFSPSVSIGPGVNLIAKHGSTIEVGEGTYFTSDSHIEAQEKITIGRDCAISWGISIIDSDHHQILTSEKDKKRKTKAVSIGNHCWLGCNVTILKGTELGDNCVVAAGSVVKGKYPANSLIGGVPAKILKQDVTWE